VLTASLSPGVYYQTVDATAPIGTGVRTDIAAFVGIADRGPLDTPVAVESWRQFVARFGGFIGGGYLAYVVRAFFENEGRRCWIVRVASRDPLGGATSASDSVAAPSPFSSAVWRVSASSPGTWGNGLAVRLTETRRAQARGYAIAGDSTALRVSSTAGFERATLVRISQPGVVPHRYRVVSSVDATHDRLVWVNDRPEQRLAYDEPLDIDASLSVHVESVEYSIAVKHHGVPVAVYDRVTLIPEHPAYGPRLLPAPDAMMDAFRLTAPNATDDRTAPSPPAPIALEELRARFRVDPVAPRGRVFISAADVFANANLVLKAGTDGLTVLRIDDFLGEPFAAEDPPELRTMKRRGVRALDDVDEVAVVAMPDIHIRAYRVPEMGPGCIPDPCLPTGPTEAVNVPPIPAELPPVFSIDDVYRAQAALVDHCEERRDRIALLDVPFTIARDEGLGISAVQAWRSRFDTKFAALYYPWLHVVDPLRGAATPTRAIPPCGHVAGQIARTDLEIGVHQSAANEPLIWAEDVSVLIDDTIHGLLNDRGINVLRPLPGRGLRILGARLASSDPSWRYVSVRRLMLMVIKAIDLATQWVVFEPNNDETRNKLRLALTVYLTTLWSRGALAGKSAEAAFFVKCDVENNPPALRDNGQLLADVGIAPTNPWEFIVLRVWRAGNELEISDAAAIGARGGV
jgi:hypothetical protein